jgi:hypothetical protein
MGAAAEELVAVVDGDGIFAVAFQGVELGAVGG